MWNEPTDREFAILPPLYSTSNILAEDKLIHLRFFAAGFNWYAVEFDGQDTFMGFVVAHDDPASAEWGYFSLSELRTIKHNDQHVDRDSNWKPVPAGQIGIKASKL